MVLKLKYCNNVGSSGATLWWSGATLWWSSGATLWPAVVDKSGYLWTGSGTFLCNGAGTYSVMRFDTSITTVNDASKPILAFTMSDQANVRTC